MSKIFELILRRDTLIKSKTQCYIKISKRIKFFTKIYFLVNLSLLDEVEKTQIPENII